MELTAALLKSLDREYRDLLSKPGAHDSILRRFSEASSYVRGRKVRIEENGGFEGVTEGLDARGFLAGSHRPWHPNSSKRNGARAVTV